MPRRSWPARSASTASRCSSPASSASRSSLGALLLDGYLRREDLEGPEWYVLMLLSASGGVTMASANDLIVLVRRASRSSRSPAYVLAAMHSKRLSVPGGRAQVLRARGVLLGVPAVRHRPDLRRDRLDQPGRDPGVPVRHGASPRTACCWPAWRSCSSASGSRSARCRSTPGRPTCTRASPSPVAALHGLGDQGRRVRRAAPGVRRDASGRPTARTGARWSTRWRCCRCVVGSLHGDRADQRQADAGLLLDQPRRVHPGGASRPPRPQGTVRRAVLPAGLHVHGRRQLRRRHDHGRGPATACTRLDGLPGPGPRPGPGIALLFTVFLLAQAGVPFTGGFLAKFYVINAVVDEGQYVLAVDRHGLRGDRRVPVPADRRGDVLRASHGVRRRRGAAMAGSPPMPQRRPARRCASPPRPASHWASPSWRPWRWASCPARPPPWPTTPPPSSSLRRLSAPGDGRSAGTVSAGDR